MLVQKYLYYRKALNEIAKPCAFVDMDALEKNTQMIVDGAKDKKIRVASKSIRSVEVLRKIFASSNVFQGIMSFTAEEAIYLHEQGFDDLLIAYPIWNENQLRLVCQKIAQGATITLMVDSLEHIEHLEMIANKENGTFLVCMDIDLSSDLFGIHFGVHRSPIKKVTDAIAIANRILLSNELKLDGIMGYEAQIAGVTDADPSQRMRSKMVQMLKRKSTKELIEKRASIVEEIEKVGGSFRFVNGGGTGSLHQTTEEKHITEVTVGSGFFNSHLFDKYLDFQYEPVAGFAIEITRIPQKGIYTCFGGGYVASGAANKDKLPEIYLPKGAKLTANEGVGEVQTPVVYKGRQNLTHGDPIFLRHSKSGELCERFKELHIIKDGKVIDQWMTYRGDGKCFL